MGVAPCRKCAKAVPAAKRPGGYKVEAHGGKAHLVKYGVLACADAPEEPEEKIARLEAEVAELRTWLLYRHLDFALFLEKDGSDAQREQAEEIDTYLRKHGLLGE